MTEFAQERQIRTYCIVAFPGDGTWMQPSDGVIHFLSDEQIKEMEENGYPATPEQGDGGYQIVPGMSPRTLGYYLCDQPRQSGDENVIGVISSADHDNYNDEE